MSMMQPAPPGAGGVVPDLGGLTPEQSAGQHLDMMQQGKVPPDQANYGPSVPGGPRCDQCIHFMPPNVCEIVAGDISPDGVSDMFEDQNAAQGPSAQPPAEGAPPPPEGAPLP